MNEWKQALREGAVTGTVACALSLAVMAAAGRRDAGSAAAPVNAVSHWLWGEDALREDHATVRHTLVGYLTHHLSAIFWAVLYARLWGHRPQAKSLPQAVAGGVATTAIASAIDYGLVPRRLQPGFEQRLSTPSTVAAFGAIAIGLALGALLLRERG